MRAPESDSRARSTRARRGLVRAAVGVAAAGAALAVAWAGGCVNVGERLFYYPDRASFVTPAWYEDVWFEAEDGVRLHGWFMRATGAPAGEARPTVVHVHGNAGNMAVHDGFSSFLRDQGFHVLLFDYRGYGRSDQARPTRAGLLRDTRAALAAARARGDVGPIAVYGQSLGGAFALAAAAEDPGVRAAVIVSGFSSWRGVAGDHAPVLGPVLIRPGCEPRESVARLGDRAVLIVHGDADGVVGVRHARVLEEAARGAGVRVETEIVPGGDHVSMLDGSEATRQAIGSFLARELGGTEGDPERGGP